jgi:putative tricarboxylic transport membrane protein
MRQADRIAGALLFAFAAAFAGGALWRYEYWSRVEGPGPGFMPFWLGLVMAVLAAMLLLSSLKQKDPGAAWLPSGEGLKRLLVVLAVSIAYVALLRVIGMTVGTALFLIVLIRFLDRQPWWMCFAIGVAAAIGNYLVFVYWLKVPFPEGMFWSF